MKKLALLLAISLYGINSLATGRYETSTDTINDGPYVFYVNDTLWAIMIENSAIKKYQLTAGNYSSLKPALGLSGGYRDLLRVFYEKTDYRQSYKKVDSIIAISDVHGQYETYIDHLTANGVIDENLNWKFGKGHLVFLGDCFDRGSMVTEILWHLFDLERQAKKAGGKVHVMIGNHESMVLSGDLRYLNDKYRKVEELTGVPMYNLFPDNSVLGKWLRTRPVMVTINDILFVHAGVSIELARRQFMVKDVNEIFSSKIIGNTSDTIYSDAAIDFLTGNDGPLWYRGYFTDTAFSESQLDSILLLYGVNHIVVGHTTQTEVQLLFNNKIFGIDTGIVNEEPGEVLLYKEGAFYRCSIKGKRTRL